jgi:hypothetical protein
MFCTAKAHVSRMLQRLGPPQAGEPDGERIMNAFQLVGKFLMLKHPVQVSTIRSNAIITAVYTSTVLRLRISLLLLW